MRLWLKDSERRPDPAPAKTDDRIAMTTGLVLWLVALVVLLFVAQPLAEPDRVAWLFSCGIGIALGITGLGYTQFKRRKG